MLANPDIAPSTSINRCIISILAFHFTLVHVPGVVHGPDGLSRRPTQPGDLPEKDNEEEFDDWIDKFYGFSHFINPTRPSLYSPTPAVALFASEETDATQSPLSSPTPSTEPLPISLPRNSAAIHQDD
jgi:hypothetical protein